MEDIMQAEGRCHCGAISYAVLGEVVHHALCHCTDCRRASGAPAVSWALFARDAVRIYGEPRVYASSAKAQRHFCAVCGTSLFYTSDEIFPGQIDIQSATLDDPGMLALQCHVQTVERISWMERLDAIPAFTRYPEAPS
jgi:hypothetical protein